MKSKNPYIKRGLVQARVTNTEMQQVLMKSLLYTQGNVSEYVRLACVNYRQPIKNKVGK